MTQKKKSICCSVICVILFVCLLGLFMPGRVIDRKEREEALLAHCGERLALLSGVCRKYAEISQGKFPGDPNPVKMLGEVLKDCGVLQDESLIVCPSTMVCFPKTTFCFIPGTHQGMSPKMPCVIEKITNHERMIGVVYVDGTTAQVSHQCQNYSELLPLFRDKITEEEAKLLLTHLKRLDIP